MTCNVAKEPIYQIIRIDTATGKETVEHWAVNKRMAIACLTASEEWAEIRAEQRGEKFNLFPARYEARLIENMPDLRRNGEGGAA
ncbi:MAG TPA: hypothetical protein VHX65_13400 [Pirellulales bacterium]|jgi:hypothetical protein|nr:hypothetical protein [Pirellulales bacterium]